MMGDFGRHSLRWRDSESLGPKSKGRAKARPDYCLLPAIAGSIAAAAVSEATLTAASITVASGIAAKARLARPRLVNLDVPALELGIVELLNRLGRFLRGRHLDEAEALGLARELVRDHGDALNLPRR